MLEWAVATITPAALANLEQAKAILAAASPRIAMQLVENVAGSKDPKHGIDALKLVQALHSETDNANLPVVQISIVGGQLTAVQLAKPAEVIDLDPAPAALADPEPQELPTVQLDFLAPLEGL